MQKKWVKRWLSAYKVWFYVQIIYFPEYKGYDVYLGIAGF